MNRFYLHIREWRTLMCCGPKCQSRTAIPNPKLGVFPLHYILDICLSFQAASSKSNNGG